MDAPPVQASSRRRWVTAGVAAVVLIAAWAGYVAGTHRSHVRWHTGTALAVEAQIMAQVDGLSYSIPLDVPWEDATGGQHQGDRPECLPPTGQTMPVRFAEVTVNLLGGGWRQVVFVSCKA